MVLIHMTVGYIDLFANAFLAIGVCSFVRMFIFNEQNDLSLLLWGMFGLACAAWSKFQLVPLCALFFLLFLFMQMKGACLATQRKYARVVVVLIAILLASAPYGKNAVKYKNPFWPVAIPFLEETFPHMENPRAIMNFQIDPGLRDLSRFSVFFLSLFEVYNGRTPEGTERYNIDQGGRLYGTKAFRMGGFWYVAVVLFNVTLFTMAMLHEKRKGILLLFGAVMVYCLLAFLPQSYELRYYQFLPLSWAALIAMLFTLFSEKYEKIAILLLAVFVFSFAYMSLVNRTHYRIEKIGYHELAVMNGAERIWKDLVQGKTYCVDRSYPSAFFFTGPTMTEFNIVVRENKEHCPHNGSFIQVAP